MNYGELRSLEYNPEREREERIAQAELGRKYRVASEVLDEVLTEQRENVIRKLEGADMAKDSDAIGLVLYLRVLRIFWDTIKTRIELGEVSEEELRNDGE